MQVRKLAMAAAATLAMVGWAGAATTKTHTVKTSAHTLSGTIQSYDAAAQTLSVKTAKGAEAFSTAGAKVWSGTKSVALDQLSSDVGARVKVTYQEKEGQKAATTIHVTPPSTKAAK
jgi:hypothetical protein